jgi:hypothetical protein
MQFSRIVQAPSIMWQLFFCESIMWQLDLCFHREKKTSYFFTDLIVRGNCLEMSHILDRYMDALILKRRQKICLNLLIKKERIAQLINGKPDENRYNKTT